MKKKRLPTFNLNQQSRHFQFHHILTCSRDIHLMSSVKTRFAKKKSISQKACKTYPIFGRICSYTTLH